MNIQVVTFSPEEQEVVSDELFETINEAMVQIRTALDKGHGVAARYVQEPPSA